MKVTPIHVNEALKNSTIIIKIKGVGQFKARLRIAKWLIMLACRILKCGLKWEDDQT